MSDFKDDLSTVTALGDPTRRRVYVRVAASAEPMSRDQVADALGLPRSTAAFHLERLIDEGLLDFTQVRRGGKAGPGAGRPTKLYMRSGRQVSVSIPPRLYELAARMLGGAIEESGTSGRPAGRELAKYARQAGAELCRSAGGATVEGVLAQQGFEPRHDGSDIVLGNCPFQSLATEFPQTVCGMNLHLVGAMVEASGDTEWSAELDPAPDQCCVRLRPAA